MAFYIQNSFINNIFNSLSAVGLFYNGIELSGSNYSRIPIFPSYHLQLVSDALFYYILNISRLSFGKAEDDWGPYNQIGIFGGTTPNLWFLIDVGPRTVKANEWVFIDIRNLVIIIPKHIT
jgi:hypothetical protein